jgi:hypothetical protein
VGRGRYERVTIKRSRELSARLHEGQLTHEASRTDGFVIFKSPRKRCGNGVLWDAPASPAGGRECVARTGARWGVSASRSSGEFHRAGLQGPLRAR